MDLILNMLNLTSEQKQAFTDLAGDIPQIFAPAGMANEPKTPVDPALFQKATIILGNPAPAAIQGNLGLRFLQTHSAGYDHYLAPGILPPDCELHSGTGGHGIAVGEHMFAMLLSMLRNLPAYREQQLHGTWQDQGPVRSVTELTVLVIGTGDLGSTFASLCHGVGARTMGVRRNPEIPARGIDAMYGIDDLDSLLPKTDAVCLMLPQNPGTIHLMDERRLRLMKDDAFLLNGGRGSAIDTEALIKVLGEGKLKGVGLDVAEGEPLPEGHPLRMCERVIMTPHIAGALHMTKATRMISDIALANLTAFLRKNR